MKVLILSSVYLDALIEYPLCTLRVVFLDSLTYGKILELIGIVFNVFYVHHLQSIMFVFYFHRVVYLLYVNLSSVNLSRFVSCICLYCDSLLSSPNVIFVFFKLGDPCVCGIFEVLELIGIVFKVVYLHEILCV